MNTEDIRLCLAIPTTASWAPGRKETLAKLKEDFWMSGVTSANDRFTESMSGMETLYFEHDNRSSRREWSELIWEWGKSLGEEVTHFLQLQDDLRVPSFFWPALRAMIAARPDQVICLQSAHQDGPEVFGKGFHGYTTVDGLLGPAYVLPRAVLLEFLEWRQTKLEDGGLDQITEDTMIGIFCMTTGKRIWAPLPSIVDHPCQVKSTYGNDRASRQRSSVRWNDNGVAVTPEEFCDPAFWAGEPQHLGRFYDVTPAIARRYVKGYTADDYKRDMSEELRLDAPACSFCGKRDGGVISKETGALMCGSCLRGMAPMVGARFPKPGTPLVLVATPLKGHPHPMHADAICRLRSEETLNVEQPYEVAAWHMPSDDLVRVRSRIARDIVALKRAGKPVTHLLLVDGDVAPDTRVVHGMLAAKKPFVTAPYPLRVHDWREVEKLDHRPAEARAYQYWHIERLPGEAQVIDGTGCTEIASNGLGCALIEVQLLERMVEHYGQAPKEPDYDIVAEDLLYGLILRSKPEEFDADRATNIMKIRAALRDVFIQGTQVEDLRFDDIPMPGMPAKDTVALFGLSLRDRKLLSEDKSFCRRVRAMGEKVWMYVGPGAPVDHFGEARFRGMIESLDIRPMLGAAAE